MQLFEVKCQMDNFPSRGKDELRLGGANTYAIREVRGLELVNLADMEYASYLLYQKKIAKLRIGRI